MSLGNSWLVIPGQPVLSGIILAIIFFVLAYLARAPMLQAIHALGRVLYRMFRLAARSVAIAERRLDARNREVLLASGREAAERMVDREFHRIERVVNRDLQAYPELHRRISEHIRRIDEDFRNNNESPPTPPEWVKAVEAVAKLQETADPAVASVLGDIRKSLVRAQEKATHEYRKAAARRHRLLAGMAPSWRGIERDLSGVGKGVNTLLDRSGRIDRQMEEFEEIRNATDRAQQTLSSSSLTQFFVSALVMAIAIGGAMINFYLISRPMQEMVGGNSTIGPFLTANIAAMVIIFVELSMGLFLMESLRITRLFPVIGALDDRMRHRMIWITFGFLVALACVESGLALMRATLAASEQQLLQSLGNGGAAAAASAPQHQLIPMITQMVLSFILPFALAFVAIPLESLVQSARTVLGVVGVVLLRALRFVLRLLGNASVGGAGLLARLYDLLIFVPLRVEALFLLRRGGSGGALSGSPRRGED
ncbi:MAG TPA: hypothetical protein VFA86_09150 [Gammaproteobacteria bacterium]|nr:hypothetical protein [Gammaproteobacteria bacterium]